MTQYSFKWSLVDWIRMRKVKVTEHLAFFVSVFVFVSVNLFVSGAYFRSSFLLKYSLNILCLLSFQNQFNPLIFRNFFTVLRYTVIVAVFFSMDFHSHPQTFFGSAFICLTQNHFSCLLVHQHCTSFVGFNAFAKWILKIFSQSKRNAFLLIYLYSGLDGKQCWF